MPDVIKNNPAAFLKAGEALVIAIVGLAAAFGLHVTPDQQTAILNLTGAIVFIAILFTVPAVATTVPRSPTATAPPSAIQNLPPLPPEPPPAPPVP